MSFRWGCEHERNAIEAYSSSAKHNHSDLEVVEAGFFIDPERPYLGASPVGIDKYCFFFCLKFFLQCSQTCPIILSKCAYISHLLLGQNSCDTL